MLQNCLVPMTLFMMMLMGYQRNNKSKFQHDGKHGGLCWMKVDELLDRSDVHNSTKGFFANSLNRFYLDSHVFCNDNYATSI